METDASSGRYARQVIMPEIGERGQERIRASTAVIVGVGALGSVQAELLARAGIGKLILIDFDVVELSNLQRQALYTTEDVGTQKVHAAAARIAAINPDVSVQPIAGYLTFEQLKLLDDADVVLDGTDNLESRFLLNEYCCKHRIPAVFASAVADKGSVLVVDKRQPREPCFACVFEGRRALEDCGSAGVLNGSTHLVGTVAAQQAFCIILGQPVVEGLFSFSLFTPRFDTLKASQRPGCPVCSGKYDRLDHKRPFSLRYCVSAGGVRASPVANTVSIEKVKKLAGKNAKELPDGSVEAIIDGIRIVVDPFGGALFPGLKNLDDAKPIIDKLRDYSNEFVSIDEARKIINDE